MRHGRAKAARKTLRYFERTVNLKSKPYYSVLLDATFLIAMIRITSNNASSTEESSKSESTIVSRIERVLQVNSGGGSSFSGFARDERLSGVVGGYDCSNNSQQRISRSNNSNGSGHSHHFNRYNVRYFIPQEAVDEINTILRTFQELSQNIKAEKKKNRFEEKAKVFEDALSWIKANSSKKHSHRGSGRCEVLPKLEAEVEPPNKKKKKKQLQEVTESETGEANNESQTIDASDAVLRHIARDDGREDPETNQKIPKKQQQSSSFTRTYIVASQEEDLLNELRMLGTVPILRCTNNASVLILESPSKKGQRTDSAKEHTKWKGALKNPAEKALVDAAWEAQKKDKVKITGISEQQARGQNTRAKGPNPLSCKRKRIESQPQKSSGETKSKRRRVRAQRSKAAAGSSNGAVSPKELKITDEIT